LPVALKKYFVISSIFALGNSSDAFLLLQLSQSGVPLIGLTMLLVRFRLALPRPIIANIAAAFLVGIGVYLFVQRSLA